MKKITMLSCILFTTIVQNYLRAQSVTAHAMLDINNISARVNNGGDNFWDPANSTSSFEIPKGTAKHTIYNQGLWIGGLDPGNALHLAQQTYRQASLDYQSGPVDLFGNPSSSPAWDYVWKINKSDILYHIANYNQQGYVVPADFASWPGNGTGNFAPVLAPFVDVNSNLIYEPASGDYPYIHGDQSTYTIYNDFNHPLPLGVEVHQEVYAFDNINSYLNNSIFMRYEIVNRSQTNYHDVYIGFWFDYDLGNYLDDYIGTDVNNNSIYAYNGDSDDEGNNGYGTNIPVQAFKLLNHNLYASNAPVNANGVFNGIPQVELDYYNYLKGLWINGDNQTRSCDGFNSAAPVCNFIFDDGTDPLFAGLGHNEALCNNTLGDRRMFCSIGPFSLNSNGVITIDAVNLTVEPMANFTALQRLNQVSQLVQADYQSGALSVVNLQTSESEISLGPNPATDFVTINSKVDQVLSLIDATGKQLATINAVANQPSQINCSQYARGVYAIRSLSSKSAKTYKLILK